MKVWLSNTYDPADPERLCSDYEEEYWHLCWLEDKIIGLPRASKAYTVKQMQEMKLVGVYANVSFGEWLKRLFKGWL